MALRLRPGRAARQAGDAPDAPAAAEKQPERREPAPRAVQQPAEKPALLDEVLIEEVSIDGMCGVY